MRRLKKEEDENKIQDEAKSIGEEETKSRKRYKGNS